ncbi:MAG: TonB-dependent receptor, partial [Oxalobacteraceae bacterium]|nr:TonB-dependent receptor [Oxalobacteraceae bacterium]
MKAISCLPRQGRSRVLSPSFATCLLLLPVAHASTQLPEVVVTSSRTEQLQTDTLLHTTVITADRIRQSQQQDLPSLLRAEAGIQITQTGGIGSATGFFMRGAATRQTLVLVDGVPITKQDATGTVSIEHLMLAEIDRIEIVRGNVSSIYGSGAVGGVIQIF